jgi:hypothetical protein
MSSRQATGVSAPGWALLLVGATAHLLARWTEPGGVRFARLAAAVSSAGVATAPRRAHRGPSPGLIRCSGVVGGGVLGALLLGGLSHGFQPDAVLAELGALTLVVLADVGGERQIR